MALDTAAEIAEGRSPKWVESWMTRLVKWLLIWRSPSAKLWQSECKLWIVKYSGQWPHAKCETSTAASQYVWRSIPNRQRTRSLSPAAGKILQMPPLEFGSYTIPATAEIHASTVGWFVFLTLQTHIKCSAATWQLMFRNKKKKKLKLFFHLNKACSQKWHMPSLVFVIIAQNIAN